MKGQRRAVALALHCAAWQLATTPRPLSPSSPAEDEQAEADWQAAGDRLLATAPLPLDHRAALRLLADRGKAGRTARAAAREALCERGWEDAITHVVAFGPGWREAGYVSLH